MTNFSELKTIFSNYAHNNSMQLFTHNFLLVKHIDKYFSSIGTFMFRCCYEYTSGNSYGQSNKFSFRFETNTCAPVSIVFGHGFQAMQLLLIDIYRAVSKNKYFHLLLFIFFRFEDKFLLNVVSRNFNKLKTFFFKCIVDRASQ